VSQTKSAADLVTLKKLLDDKSSDQQRTAELNKIKEAEVQDLRLQVSRTAAELAVTQRDSANEIGRLHRDLDAAKRDSADLRTKNLDLGRRATASAARISELESRNSDLERSQQAHDLELELFRTKAAESMLHEREKCERDLAETRAQFQELEDAAVQAKREKDAARRDVDALRVLLEAEQATVAAKEKARRRLEDQVEQQHVVLADLDKINGDLRSELAATKARLAVAEEKAGRTVVSLFCRSGRLAQY
jgi:myosin protein heavy chain